MRKKLISFLLTIFVLAWYPNNAQTKILEGSFSKNQEIFLLGFYGLKIIPLDTCKTDKKGRFSFADKNYLTGFYRLSSQGKYTDVILSENEPTLLIFESDSIDGDMTVIKGENQRGLIALKNHKKKVREKLRKLLEKNPDNAEEVNTIRTHDLSESQNIVAKYPGTFFQLTANLAIAKPLESELLKKYDSDTLRYMNEHFFDAVDFSNEALCRSTILPNLYMKYLSAYIDYDETGFKKAVDYILSNAKKNQNVYNLSLEYLLSVFGEVGPELIFEYVVEHYYLENSCDVQLSGEALSQINNYRGLSPGQLLPAVKGCLDEQDHVVNLNTVFPEQPTLLFFWSTHCSFCSRLIEIIQKNKPAGIRLVGINIDAEKTAWENFNSVNKPAFINLYSPGGWESEAARAFMVNKTPTIYLVDQYRKIQKKNLSIEEMIPLLQEK